MRLKIISLAIFVLIISACSGRNDNLDITPTIAGIEQPLGLAPTPEEEVLRIDNLNKVPPNDVIQEIAYFGGLGSGGGCLPVSFGKPTFLIDYSQGADVEVYSPVITYICEIPVDETVQIEISLPDGSSQSYQAISQIGGISFEYVPDLRGPIGEYRISFSGNGWLLERKIEVFDSDSPRLYLVNDSELIFYRFQPYESVRLFIYSDIPETEHLSDFAGWGNQELIGWKVFQVDSYGNLTISIAIVGEPRFVAVGDRSGQVVYQLPYIDADYMYWSQVSRSDFYCPGASNPIGIKPNSYAQVITDSVPLLDFQGNMIEMLQKGAILRIDSNPQCVDNRWRWGVSCIDRSCEGYVFENEEEAPNLEGVSNLPPTPTSAPAIIPACQGTKPTRLQVGMNAKVTTSGMAPQLSLRAQPNLGAEKIHVIAAGRTMVILVGPICADSSYWWYICQSSDYNVPVVLTQARQRSSPTMYQKFAATMYQ